MRVSFAHGRVDVSLGAAEEELTSRRVWYHPGSFDLLEQTLGGKDTDRGFIARQYSVALAFLESWLEENCDCIDAPSRQRKWSNKLIQLAELTAQLGSNVPKTVLLADFDQLELGRVVKRLSESRAFSRDRDVYAQVVDDRLLERLRSGATAPVLSQELVESAAEYRRYAFGDHSATLQFGRQKDGQVVDLHYFPDIAAGAAPCDASLPDSLWARVDDALGLRLYAADYTVLDGHPLLLEVNPLFSWFWLPDDAVDAVASAARRGLGS